MGDGTSDMGWRAELGDEGNDEWFLKQIPHDRPLLTHRSSVRMRYHRQTVKRLEDAGRITVNRRDDWLEISHADDPEMACDE